MSDYIVILKEDIKKLPTTLRMHLKQVLAGLKRIKEKEKKQNDN